MSEQFYICKPMSFVQWMSLDPHQRGSTEDMVSAYETEEEATMKPLTKTQASYLDYITMYHQKNGVGVRQKQLSEHFKASPSSVHSMLKRLIEQGCITKEGPKGMVLPVSEPTRSVSMPSDAVYDGLYVDDIIQETAQKIVARMLDHLKRTLG